jgi:hypothetical protein
MHNLIVLYKRNVNEQIIIHVKISSIGIEHEQQRDDDEKISCE